MNRRYWMMMALLCGLSVGLWGQPLVMQTAEEMPAVDEMSAVDESKGMGCGERFVAMPDSLLPMLSAVNRADLVDFMANGMKAEVNNRLAGRTRMTQLTPTYLRLQHSDLADWQMKLLTTHEGDTLICVAQTVRTPVVDSHLLLFDSRWNPLPLEQVMPQPPQLNDFLSPEAHSILQSQHALATLLLTEATFSADEELLEIRYTTPDTIDEEVRKRLEPYLHSPLTYRWQGERFERMP